MSSPPPPSRFSAAAISVICSAVGTPASTLMVVVPAVLANWWPCAPPADTTLDFGNASEAAAAVGVVAARAKRRNVATATRRISPIKILLGLRDERDRAALGKASSVAMPSGRF